MFVIIKKERMSQQFIIFIFLKSNTVLKVLFSFILVNEDLEKSNTCEEGWPHLKILCFFTPPPPLMI